MRKWMWSWNTLLCGAALGLLAGSPAAAISLGQVDDFQNGALQLWTGGANPVNVPTGGPAGAGDRYLQISADNGNLGANNQSQWTGDYLAAGVTALRIMLNNEGATPLAIRISVFGAGTTAFTSTDEVVLAPGSGWITAEFAIDAASLTQTAGSGTLAATLAGVTRLLLRHDPDPISSPGQINPVTGTLGIDNIQAVPEPTPVLLMALGLVALAGQRARGRGNRGA